MIRRLLQHCLIGLLACIGLAQAAEEPLPPDQAFRLSTRALDDSRVEVAFDIAPGYYLYRNKFGFAFGAPATAQGDPSFPAGESHTDAFFGTQTVFRGALRIVLPVNVPLAQDFPLTVSYQGCADLGVCYPPSKKTVNLRTVAMSVAPDAGGRADNPLGALANPATPMMDLAPAAALPAPARDSATPAYEDDSSRIARLLRDSTLPLIVLSFVGFGLLLSLTPCVLPMVPILSALIVGQGSGISRGRAFSLSAVYVLGMALTYTLAGVLAGLAGATLAAALQTPWVLGGFALLLAGLALGMFGVYEVQLPGALQARLSALVNRMGGSFGGTAAMGALSALIVGPCVTAPLAGAIIFVAQTQNAQLGGVAFFSLAIGMGLPLLAVGMGAHLLRSGPWMESVKRFFGVLLLGTALWLVSPVLPALANMLMWAALLALAGMLLGAIHGLPPQAAWRAKLAKVAGLALMLLAGLMLVGAIAGSRDPLDPLSGLRGGSTASGHTPFERVASVQELDARLASAGKPVMLDFYADWCVSCKEMERFTFSDPAIRQQLDGFVLLQADVTQNTEADQALLKRFGLFGPPGIIFFDANGREIPGLRVVGFMGANRFGGVLEKAQGE